jgi:DNA polymerase-3 subunit alpha
MAALLSSEKDNVDKVVKYVDEVKRIGIDLLPPDINKSDLVFNAQTINSKESVLFGMGAIKGAGDVAIKSIIAARNEGGEFKDLSDFISRIDSSKVNKRVIESLIKSGALDSFEYSRQAMLTQVEKIVEAAGKAALAKKMAVGSLFGDDEEMVSVDISLDQIDEYDQMQILEFEKESLGFYVSGHPLDKYREQLDAINYTLSSEIDELADGSEALIVGKIEEINERISKKGNKFGIATLMDLHGNIELMLFENHLKELEEDFDLSKPIAFKVRAKINDFGIQLSIKKIESLKDAKKEKIKTKQVQVEQKPLLVGIDYSDNIELMYELFEIIAHNQGKREIKLIFRSKLGEIELDCGYKINQNVDNLLLGLKDKGVNIL